MKVAVIADPLDNQNAGVHVYTREMIRSMIEANPGHELILIREKKDPELKGVRQIGLWNTRLPIGYASLRLFILIPLILRRERVDVVIEPAHFGPFNLPGRTKRVTVIHDLTPILFPELHRWHSQLLQRLFLKRIMRNADLIVANSDHTKRDICKYSPNACDKVVRIYPAVAENRFGLPEGVLERYGVKEPYFLTVGTIEPRKDHLLLLRAFREFRESAKGGCQLVVTGGRGWKSEAFFESLSEHPYREDIVITGFVPDEYLPILYQKALGLVYPSKYEGFGLPVLEAMKWGTIPILSRNSSLPEVGGESALYLEGRSYNELALLMQRLSEMMEEERSAKIRKLRAYESQFSWKKFGETLWKQLTTLSQ